MKGSSLCLGSVFEDKGKRSMIDSRTLRTWTDRRSNCSRIHSVILLYTLFGKGCMCELCYSQQLYRDVLSNLHGLATKRSRHHMQLEYGVQMLN
jgi:hypothetical protein